VAGVPHHFFHQERFCRLLDGRRQASVDPDDGWRSVDDADVPPGMVVICAESPDHEDKARQRGRRHHPAKHDEHDD
jgi:hypothetical protein